MCVLKMCRIFVHCTWLSCTFFIFTFSYSSADQEVLSNQRRSVFREAGSSQAETNAYISTSTVPSSVLKSAQSQVDENEVGIPRVNPPPQRNLIKNDKIKITPTSNNDIMVSTYRIKDPEEETTCILMTVDALLSFIYPSNIDSKEERDVFLPDSDKLESLTGDCSDGERSSMTLKWKTFKLNFDFSKTPGGERWFVSSIQLSFNTDSIVAHSKHPNTVVQAETVDGDIMFITPVGRSFKCHHEIEINLTDPQYPDIKVKLLLRELTVEPFIFKNDGFGPEYLCAATGAGAFRSETAPFIFGSLLTLASLGTIAGYAVYRYVRVNKVQYDTME